MTHLSEIQIDSQALRHNLTALTNLCQTGVKRAAVVKGNAYGHGLPEAVAALEGQVDYFQVDDVAELAELRKVSQTPALVLGFVPASRVEDAYRLGAELALYDAERLPAFQRASEQLGRPVLAHLKIDALLGRQGIVPGRLGEFIQELGKYPGVQLAGAYSHFANIEDTTDLTHAQEQAECFTRAMQELAGAGFTNLERHESATSGLMAYEPSRPGNTIVRIGVGLYGLYPSNALERSHRQLALKPVMKWVTHLAQVKTLPAKHPVGYGLTYITSQETRVGIVPQGYSDGYDRGLSNSGDVLVRGKRCPVIGRVAMNMFAVDLSAVPESQSEDEVVLLGTQGEDCITAEEIAQRIGTINYEVVTRISPLLPRVRQSTRVNEE